MEGLGARSLLRDVRTPDPSVLLSLWRQLVVIESYAPESQINVSRLLEQTQRVSPDLTAFLPRSKTEAPALSAISQARFSAQSLNLSSSQSEPPLTRSELLQELWATRSELDQFRSRIAALEHTVKTKSPSPPAKGAPPGPSESARP